VIPAKNEEEHIVPCLKSIQDLEYPHNKIEVIVVDNGSNDATRERSRKLGAKVFVKTDCTIAALRNLGVEQAQGEIIGFIDADVTVGRYWLKNAVHYFNHDEIACVGTSPKIREQATWVEKARYLGVLSRPDIYEAKWICSMNLLIRKSVFQMVNGFNEELVTCEDVDLCYRIGRLKQNNKIIRDRKIEATHFGEARTLMQLFKKERWRATSNYTGIRSHGIILHELPSLLFPLLNSILLIVAIILFMLAKPAIALFILAAICIFPTLITLKIILKTGKFIWLPRILAIQFIYTLARIFATYGYAGSLVRSKITR